MPLVIDTTKETVWKYTRSKFESYLKCWFLENRFLWVRFEGCHHEHLVAFSWPLLRIHAPAAFVLPARHHAEGFSRGLPYPVAVRGEWQKAPPCWLMMCCPMSPLGNGYWASLFNLGFCLPAIPRLWEKYWVLCIAHLLHISLKSRLQQKDGTNGSGKIDPTIRLSPQFKYPFSHALPRWCICPR